jgi:hypothetical protein
LAGSHQAGDDVAKLGGCHCGGVVGRTQADRVQQGCPRGASCFQRSWSALRPRP